MQPGGRWEFRLPAVFQWYDDETVEALGFHSGILIR